MVIAGYPLAFLISAAQWIMLALFGVTVTIMATLMGRLMCARCMNFACPFNGVDPATRALFFACNPVVARAWQDEGTD